MPEKREEADGVPERCPLCDEAATAPFAFAGGRDFLRCPRCLLTFVSRRHHLDAAAERARYDTHRNDPADAGYRKFLSRLVDPLADALEPGVEGLDFGSGPGPTLSVMMRERGFPCEDYDPFYAPDEAVLARAYDFVACTEVIEHFFRPADEFRRMRRLLRPGGWLGLMTEVLQTDHAFEEWWYIRDPSHVCFYRPETLAWIAEWLGLRLVRPSRNVVLLHVPARRER
jgi:SAM-dependent methyltransferase